MNRVATIALLAGALAAPFALPVHAVPMAVTAEDVPAHADDLDLNTLENRLRETRAIPVLRKLALKGEIDDLLAQIRRAHLSGNRTEVSRLRPAYNTLIDRIYAMLGKDPQLGKDILASRQSIWDLLSDQTQFASLR